MAVTSRTWLRLTLIVVPLLLVWPGILLARAALAYYADVSTCFSPLKIVGHQERIDNAVKVWKIKDWNEYQRRLKLPGIPDDETFAANNVGNKMVALDPRTCCEARRSGSIGDSVFNFRWTWSQSISHFVVPKDRELQYWPDMRDREFRIFQLSDICGQAVPWPDDITL